MPPCFDARSQLLRGRARRPVGTISCMPAIAGVMVAEEALRMLLIPQKGAGS